MGQPPATLSIFDDAASTAALADAGVTGGAGAAATLRAAALARILATGAACLLGTCVACVLACCCADAAGYARAGEVPTLASLGGAEGPSAAAAAALAGRGFGVASSHVAEERTSSDGTLLLHGHRMFRAAC
jgi:hypothetical protein